MIKNKDKYLNFGELRGYYSTWAIFYCNIICYTFMLFLNIFYYKPSEFYVKSCNSINEYELSIDSNRRIIAHFQTYRELDKSIRVIMRQYTKKNEKITIWYHKNSNYFVKIKINNITYGKFCGLGIPMIFCLCFAIICYICICRNKKELLYRIKKKKYANDYTETKDDSL